MRRLGEITLIADYLAPLAAHPGAFGLKDDAALLTGLPASGLAVTADGLVAGVHFFEADDPGDVAYKALAVNVSDLAAKGARPLAYTLTLALAEAPTEEWAQRFTAGLCARARPVWNRANRRRYSHRTRRVVDFHYSFRRGVFPRPRSTQRRKRWRCSLCERHLGGRCPRPSVAAKRRSLWAGLAACVPGVFAHPLSLSRAAAGAGVSIGGRGLRGNGYIRWAGAGPFAHVPGIAGLSRGFSRGSSTFGGSPRHCGARWGRVENDSNGGDDYEILAAVPHGRANAFEAASLAAGVPVTRIGAIVAGEGAPRFKAADGMQLDLPAGGFEHFKV